MTFKSEFTNKGNTITIEVNASNGREAFFKAFQILSAKVERPNDWKFCVIK